MRQITFAFVVLALVAFTQATDLNELSSAVESLKPVLSMFQTNVTTKVGELQTQSGFKTLQASREYTSGLIKKVRLPDIFKLWFTNLPVAQNVRDNLLESLNEKKFEDLFVPGSSVDLKFNDAKGKVFHLKVVLQPHATIADVVSWEKILWTAVAKPADSFMIITKSECNAFECSTKDEIKYVQAKFTEEHLNTLKDLDIPVVASNEKPESFRRSAF
jgi:hypothetical protein